MKIHIRMTGGNPCFRFSRACDSDSVSDGNQPNWTSIGDVWPSDLGKTSQTTFKERFAAYVLLLASWREAFGPRAWAPEADCVSEEATLLRGSWRGIHTTLNESDFPISERRGKDKDGSARLALGCEVSFESPPCALVEWLLGRLGPRPIVVSLQGALPSEPSRIDEESQPLIVDAQPGSVTPEPIKPTALGYPREESASTEKTRLTTRPLLLSVVLLLGLLVVLVTILVSSRTQSTSVELWPEGQTVDYIRVLIHLEGYEPSTDLSLGREVLADAMSAAVWTAWSDATAEGLCEAQTLPGVTFEFVDELSPETMDAHQAFAGISGRASLTDGPVGTLWTVRDPTLFLASAHTFPSSSGPVDFYVEGTRGARNVRWRLHSFSMSQFGPRPPQDWYLFPQTNTQTRPWSWNLMHTLHAEELAPIPPVRSVSSETIYTTVDLRALVVDILRAASFARTVSRPALFGDGQEEPDWVIGVPCVGQEWLRSVDEILSRRTRGPFDLFERAVLADGWFLSTRSAEDIGTLTPARTLAVARRILGDGTEDVDSTRALARASAIACVVAGDDECLTEIVLLGHDMLLARGDRSGAIAQVAFVFRVSMRRMLDEPDFRLTNEWLEILAEDDAVATAAFLALQQILSRSVPHPARDEDGRSKIVRLARLVLSVQPEHLQSRFILAYLLAQGGAAEREEAARVARAVAQDALRREGDSRLTELDSPLETQFGVDPADAVELWFACEVLAGGDGSEAIETYSTLEDARPSQFEDIRGGLPPTIRFPGVVFSTPVCVGTLVGCP